MSDMKNLEAMLDEKIPREVVSKRDGGGGRKLDYLEGWYVIDRLNKVFGHTRWSKEISDVRLLDTPKPSYLVKVRLTAYIDGAYVTKEAYGYGSDKGANNPHELAIKEAVTDALKIAAKDLGMSMGLALYDKSQEFVDDGEDREEPVETPKKVLEKSVAPDAKAKSGAEEAEKLRKYIGAAAKIAVKKGHTPDAIKDGLKKLTGVVMLDQVEDSRLTEVKTYIDSLL